LTHTVYVTLRLQYLAINNIVNYVRKIVVKTVAKTVASYKWRILHYGRIT